MALALRRALKALRGSPEQAQTTVVVKLAPDALEAFEDWFDENAERIDAAGGSFQGVYAKLPRQVLRLALVLHALEHGAEAEHLPVRRRVIAAALELADYFTAHAFRVLSRFGKGLSGTVAKVYRAYQEAEGEAPTLTEIHKHFKGHMTSEQLQPALEELCRLKLLERVPPPPGTPGRPVERYRLLRISELCEETPLPGGGAGVGAADKCEETPGAAGSEEEA